MFVSIDRGEELGAVKANLPTVRIDEITLHPRDNAMVLATHGRAIWILDHLEPIQEYAAAQAASTDAKLFTPPPFAMFRRPARDRNYEFWGDQTFFGENPPQAAVISWFNRKAGRRREAEDHRRRGTRDARDRRRRCWRTATRPASSRRAGICACSPIRRRRRRPADGADGAGREGREGGRRGRLDGSARSRRRRARFGAGCSGRGRAGGGGGFGGGANLNGPLVIGGVYTVSLIVDGKTVESKPLRVNDDPEVVLTSVERKRMFDQAMEIHALQPRINEATTAHASLTRQLAELTTTIGGRTDVPADVKASVEALTKEVAALAPRLAAPQGRGGGGRGANDSLSARLGQAKNGLMAGMSPGDQTCARTPR